MQFSLEGQYQNVRLRPLAEQDIEALRIWRNDTDNSKYITSVGHITSAMQLSWYGRYLADTDCYIFAIDETKDLGRLVGSVSLYHFDGQKAEFGKIMIGDPQAHGRGLGRKSTVLTLHIGFAVFGLQAIYAVVHVDNVPALNVYEQAGFSIVGQEVSSMGFPEYQIRVDKEPFYCQNAELDAIIKGSTANLPKRG